jgi:dienelactone hydrolase
MVSTVASRDAPLRQRASPLAAALHGAAALLAVMMLGAGCSSGVGEPVPGPGIAPGAAAAQAVHRSTVDVVLDGRRTRADVYQSVQATGAAVILAHGFTRSRATMAGHAEALAQQGMLAVAPDLPYLVDSRDNARALADLAALLRRGAFAAPADRIVMVGFSAGGLAALLASGSEGVVGYVGLDPFDRPGGVGRAFARKLRVPALLVRGPPSACNAFSIAAPWARALPMIEADRVIENASHCDFEAPTDAICRFVCGPADPTRARRIRDELLDAARRWLRP